MKRFAIATALLGSLAISACGPIIDSYGNKYGGFYDYGYKYAGPLARCEGEVYEKNVDPASRSSYLQCCMYRNGAPGKPAACG